ncbi:DUF3466 family protein [Vibrio salinus]|uniref:DUF3466 family protein n=1 Tax=Vibrio salinus TaxID=2899784 RepID=UPI001E48BB7C|nr:DUF3466 family protein [Vibrio salinus]MCE0492551.1 DUF3466 family protein [Vibrio salinus]
MKNHSIKLTALTVAMLSSFHASAALYRIVEVTPPSSLTYGTDYKSSFGTAIEPADGSEDCFDSGTACYDGSDYAYILSGETRYQKTMAGQPVDGSSFKEEVPFGLYNYKDDVYLSSESDFSDYCSDELGYSTCDSWATVFWNERNRELTGTTVTAYPFMQSSGISDDTTTEMSSSLSLSMTTSSLFNSVVTGSTDSESYGFRLSFSNTDRRDSVIPNPSTSSTTTYPKVRAFKTKTYSSTDYTVGSVSTDFNTSDNNYTSKAAIWETGAAPTELPWKNSTNTSGDDYLAEGSIRDFVVNGSTIYAVGYNSYLNNRYYMTATVFTAPLSTYTSATWSQYLVKNAEVTSGDSNYSNTRLTGINDNLVAIGESKLDNDHASGGAYSNKLFVIPDVSTVSSGEVTGATYFSDGTGNIGFTGAGGHANAINNKNEIVGQIDTETSREVKGKPRRKRGFIYPYYDGSNDYDRAIFSNAAWILDDLTNGGTYSSANNAYRILSANDINDAGVIAATAIKCPGGYSATTNDSSCSGTEKTVAVQLIPIAGATSSDISARGYETTSVERKGGSFGFLGLAGLFGFLMYRRKK